MCELGVRCANLRQVRELAARCANLPFPVLFPSLASTPLLGWRDGLQKLVQEAYDTAVYFGDQMWNQKFISEPSGLSDLLW